MPCVQRAVQILARKAQGNYQAETTVYRKVSLPQVTEVRRNGNVQP